jgi:N-carbamoylputrescine amidase
MKITIALAQITSEERKEKNMQKGLFFMQEAVRNNASIICFPEISFERFFPQFPAQKEFLRTAESIPGPTTEIFSNHAKKLKITTIINLLEKAEEGLYFDTSPVINAQGQLLGKTRMMHIADMPGFYEKFYYNEGDIPFPTYEIEGIKIGIAICYDRHYPEYIRGLVLKGAHIIFVPQAGEINEPLDMFKIEMQAAAFSNQVYICLVNRVGKEETLTFAGQSFIVDPNGKIIAHAGKEEELLLKEIELEEIQNAREKRPYLRDLRRDIYKFLSNI